MRKVDREGAPSGGSAFRIKAGEGRPGALCRKARAISNYGRAVMINQTVIKRYEMPVREYWWYRGNDAFRPIKR